MGVQAQLGSSQVQDQGWRGVGVVAAQGSAWLLSKLDRSINLHLWCGILGFRGQIRQPVVIPHLGLIRSSFYRWGGGTQTNSASLVIP